MLERQVQFWNIWLSYAFHFQFVPNMCWNDWWSHTVLRIKHFIVHRLRASQQLYYRSLKIKMIQLLRGYVPQWTFCFSFSFFPPISLFLFFFALKCVIGLLSWSHGDADCAAKQKVPFSCHVQVKTLHRWLSPVYGMLCVGEGCFLLWIVSSAEWGLGRE